MKETNTFSGKDSDIQSDVVIGTDKQSGLARYEKPMLSCLGQVGQLTCGGSIGVEVDSTFPPRTGI